MSTDTGPAGLHHDVTVEVAAPPSVVYDAVSDVTRTGEWSPVCTSCWWDEDARPGQVGAWFTGRNELPGRTWETRSVVVAAEPGVEFAWVVGGRYVRWGFVLAPTGPDGSRTRLRQTWSFLPEGLAMFVERHGDRAQQEIDERERLAHEGMPVTLAALARTVGQR